MNAQWPQNLGYTLKAAWSCHAEEHLNLSKSGFVSEEDHSGCKPQNIAIGALKGNVLCQIWFKWTYYSADTRTMNAMALFSLYLYFFFTYFNIFSQLANHSLESMQRPRLFPAFFPRYFQSGAMISNNGGDIFPISFSNFLSITVVSLLYKSGILYQWNQYNGAFWWNTFVFPPPWL